jgi:hypothetical protein
MTFATDDDLAVSLRGAFGAHESLASPERAKSIATYAVSSPSPRPHRRVLLAAGAVAALALGTTLVVQLNDGGPRPLAEEPTHAAAVPQPTHTGADDTDASHRSTTERAVRAALALGPQLPGARTATVAETGEITVGMGALPVHAVQQSAFALAPGSVDEAITYLRNHPPAGFALGGWGTGGAHNTQFADFEPSTQAVDDTDAYASLRLTVTVQPKGNGVAIRTDAAAMWRPARLAATRLPADARLTKVAVSKVPVDSRFGKPSTVHVTVTAPLQAKVLATVGALRPAIPDLAMSCPMSMVTVTDVFTFSSSEGPYTVTAVPVCGGEVTVARGGVPSPQVLGSAFALDALVDHR